MPGPWALPLPPGSLRRGLPGRGPSFPVPWRRPWRGVPRLWPVRCSCRHWPGPSVVAPMFLPTSMSAMSMERISKAVPASSPFRSTSLEMLSGFSSTCSCESADPMLDTMPSPTRARMVSSPAPPTSWWMLARTVTRALAMSWMPFLATAATGGVSITLGLTLVCTASNTSRPARSMAVAFSKGRSMLAFEADTSAWTTRCTCPPVM